MHCAVVWCKGCSRRCPCYYYLPLAAAADTPHPPTPPPPPPLTHTHARACSYLSHAQYVLKKMEIKTSSPRERDLALQEASLMAKLKHPNVVTYKDCFIQSETMYICMGFCEGGDLHARYIHAQLPHARALFASLSQLSRARAHFASLSQLPARLSQVAHVVYLSACPPASLSHSYPSLSLLCSVPAPVCARACMCV